jgi:type I restriction enzyme S subunit
MEKLLPHTKKISSFENAVYSAGPKFKNNDTLLAKITPCLENGKTAFVDILDENEIAFGSSEFIVLRAIKNISDANYIYYLARSPKFRNRAIGCMEGTSGRKRVNDKSLRNETFEIPNIQTQTAIARVLSSFDYKIELNNKINRELENMAKMIYEYWFIQNADKSWEKRKLSEIANITMGQSPDGSSYNEEGEGLVFYQGCTDFGSRFPTIRQYTTKPARFAEAGDILLSVRAPVGAINFANKKCCIGRGLAAINSKIGSITHLYFILKNLENVFNRSNTGGTTFGAITKDDLFSLPVTIPPRDILVRYEKIAKPIFEKQFEIEEESSTLAQLRDFLLPLLMNGQVTVKDNIGMVIPLKNKDNYDQRFNQWLKNQGLAARGETDLQTLREIFDAMDDDDK